MVMRNALLLIFIPLILTLVFLFLFVFKVSALLASGISFIVSTILILTFSKPIEVQGYEHLIVSRGGTYIDMKIKGGRALLFRTLDRPIPVDMRPQTRIVDKIECLTQEGIELRISYFFLWQVIDPMKYLVDGPGDVAAVLEKIATSTLMNVAAKKSLDDILSSREDIRRALEIELRNIDELKDWGSAFISIGLSAIEIPQEIEVARNRRLAATILRDALVTEGESWAEALEAMQDKVGDQALWLQALRMLGQALGSRRSSGAST